MTAALLKVVPASQVANPEAAFAVTSRQAWQAKLRAAGATVEIDPRAASVCQHADWPEPQWRPVRLGFACNNRCLVCGLGAGAAAREPDTESLRAAIATAARDGWVLFTGGEPSARRDFTELVACAKAAGSTRIGVQANGRMFAYPKFARAAAHAGLTDLGVVIFGHDASAHEYVTRTPGSFAQAAQGVRNARAAGIHVRAPLVVTKPSYRQMALMAKAALAAGAEALDAVAVQLQGGAAHEVEALAPRWSMAAGHLSAAAALAAKARTPWRVRGFPHCVLPDDGRAAANAGSPGASLAFGPMCGGCAERTACPGLGTAYAVRHGFAELHALATPAPPPEESHARG